MLDRQSPFAQQRGSPPGHDPAPMSCPVDRSHVSEDERTASSAPVVEFTVENELVGGGNEIRTLGPSPTGVDLSRDGLQLRSEGWKNEFYDGRRRD